MFRALVLSKQNEGVDAAVRTLDEQDLPPGDVTVRIAYSSLNYKDGLIIRNQAPLVRSFPHVPGIDLAGRVVESAHPAFKPDDAVVLTGWGVGERHWGGHAELARVKHEWLVPLPEGLTLKRAMALGTAGLSAMLAVLALEEHALHPGAGEVLVTGGSGGVGSVAIAVLARLGYEVAAVTGRKESHDYLKSLGAKALIDRAELAQPSTRPLEGARFAGCVDAVGGPMLPRVLAQMKYGGALAAVGNAGGNAFPGSVLPFILRAVNLLGIDSVVCPPERRRTAWQRLARDLPMDRLDAMTQDARLEDVPRFADEILAGRVRGRVVIDLGA